MVGVIKHLKLSNDPLLYINISFNHPPQVIKHIPISLSKGLNKNSSSEEIFNETKSEYETLKNSGYQKAELKFHKEEQNTQKRKWSRDIIWFNPLFSRNVTTNVAKTFLNLLDKHFPKSKKVHKIFNRNTVKVSYCCTENLSCIIRSHNKNFINDKKPTKVKCNCRIKSACPLVVTVNKIVLSKNVLHPPVLTQIKYTLGWQKENSKSDITTIISRSDTTVMLMKPLSLSTYWESKINTMRCLP